MKPTVGLIRFFGLMNLCEKSGVWANVHEGLVILEKLPFGRLQKTFFPTEKLGCFSAVKSFFKRKGAETQRRKGEIENDFFFASPRLCAFALNGIEQEEQ